LFSTTPAAFAAAGQSWNQAFFVIQDVYKQTSKPDHASGLLAWDGYSCDMKAVSPGVRPRGAFLSSVLRAVQGSDLNDQDQEG
jgi:hypothetical protein